MATTDIYKLKLTL